MNFVLYIVIGILAGFLAGKMMRGGGFGWLINLIVGVVGGVLGGWLFGIHTSSIVGRLITSVVGACLLLGLVSLIPNRSNR